MNNVHSIIYAYHVRPDLGELCKFRTPAALPFCGRYRIIDFSLSGLMHAGLFDVDVIMQFGYKPLMDHLSGGRTWNMVRHSGGLHMLVAQPEQGRYGGSMAALATEYNRFQDDISAEYILLTRGDLIASIDMGALVEAHMASDADVTVVCTAAPVPGEHNHFEPGADGFTATELLCRRTEKDRGVTSLETYILKREKLLELMRWCAEGNRLHFHRDGLMHMMREGWRVGLYMHEGYAKLLYSVKDYYDANMDMLAPEKRKSLFPKERPVATRARSDVSTYYSDTAKVTDSLVSDGCIVEGKVARSILARGVRVEPGCELRDCVILNDTVVGAGTKLNCVIADKDVSFASDLSLAGSPKLPLVIPKRAKL